MEPAQIEQLISHALPDCEVQVSTDGYHFDVVVVGDLFDGLRPVKRQQLVYAPLNDKIADGTIHAVNIKTFTPAQWAAQSDS